MRYVHINNNRVDIIDTAREEAFLRKVFGWTGKIIQTEKTIQQLVDDGAVTVPEGYVVEGESFRPMTYSEKYDSGQITKQEYTEIIIENRRAAYREESDGLFLEAIYDAKDKPDLSNWKEKVQEIKKRLPKP